MNGKKVALLIALIIFIDQAIKFYIKLNYFIGEEHIIIDCELEIDDNKFYK